MTTARYGFGSVGIQTAAIAIAGTTPTTALTSVEGYDGSSWTVMPSVSTAKDFGAASGNLSANIFFGGRTTVPSAATEEFNSSINTPLSGVWASGGNLTTARSGLAGAGTQTEALGFGGRNPGVVANTEEYNGTSWSPSGNMTTARNALGSAGTQTAGLGFGGYTVPNNSNATEEYNGSTWGPGGNMGTTRRYLAGCGTQTAALGFGGYSTANTNATEEYDGSAWTTGGNLGTARRTTAGVGTQTAGLAAGGFYNSYDRSN
jgi:hypothetical protein